MERWKFNLYILWVTQVISLSSFGLGIPFMSFYIQDMGVTDDYSIKIYTGILSMAPAVTMAIASPVWGFVADRYGRKLMILRAMFAASFIIGGMGFASEVWQLVVLRGAQGLFTGTMTASNAFVAANTPENKLSKSLGFMSSSNFIGFSIGPFLGGILAEIFGIRFSFIIGAVLMFLGFLLVLFFLKEDKTTYGKVNEKKGYGPEFKSVVSLIIIYFLVALFVTRIIRTIFVPFVPLYVQEKLGTIVGAASITGIISGITGLATAVAGITISQLGDKTDKYILIRKLLIISIVISATLVFIDSLYLFLALYGLMFFFIGGIEPIITSMAALHTHPNQRGALFGVQGFVSSLGWMISPIMGTYISVNFSIRSILIIIPVLISINILIIHMSSKNQKKMT
jgi:DHA1 family multidrug resistance protein-like MFS transporter